MKTSEEIKTWLQARVAKEIKGKPETVSFSAPFASYGLDSIVIVTLVDDLEEWLGVSLDPTIFWEYPTIEALTDWLVKEHI